MAKKIPSEMSNLKPKISKPQSLRVLMVEDSEDDALLIIRELKKGGYIPAYERVETAAAMKKALQEKQWDIILCDYRLPKFNAISALTLLKETNIDIPLIIVSGSIGEETAVECMRLGARDYIMKNNLSRLCPAITREMEKAQIINKQKQTEKALLESEEKYRTILEDMEEGYFEIDLRGNFTFVNDAQCRNLGYSREELIGMNNRQYTDKENAKKASQAFSNLYKKGEPSKIFDYEVTRKDGTKAIAELLVSLIKDPKGKPSGFRGLSRHITERKRAEEALRVSEEKYRLVVENAKEGIIIAQDLKLVFVNRAAVDMIGYSGETSVRPFTDFIYPDDRNMVVDYHVRRLKGEEVPLAYSFRLISPDGTIKWVEFNTAVIQWKERPATLSFLNDITERKQAEEKLRESEEKYRTILKNIEDGYYEVDLKGNFTFFNDSMCRILGYPQEEMMGMNNRQFTDKEKAKKLFQTFNEVYKTGKPAKGFDWHIIRKDGAKRYIEVSVSLQKDSSGKPIGFQGISRDITERKQMEESLRQSEEKYRTIIENMQEGYTELDLKGNFTLVNDKVVRDLGYTKEELIGTNSQRYRDGKNEEEIYQRYNELYKTGETIRALGVVYVSKNGTARTYELTASLIRDVEGEPIGFRAVSRDITERKQMEESLRRSEEKYRTIIETIQEGYFEIDLAGNFTFVNDAQCKITGTPREQLLGKNDRDYTSAEEAKRLHQIYSRIYKTGEPEKGYAFEFTRIDGTKGFHEVSASLMRDAEGKPIGFRGFSRDVTERKKMDDALRQNEEKYRTILNSIQEGYFEFDLAGKITFINDTLWKRLGYSKEELLGHTNEVFTDEATRKESFRAFNELYKTGVPVKALIQKNIRKDGSIRISELSVSLMRDSGGKPIGFFGTSRDVTERKQMEEVLRQSEERYRTIIETMEDGYWETDLPGNFTFVNDAECKIAGTPREQLLGRNNQQYSDKTTAKRLYEVFKVIYTTGEPVKNCEFEFFKRNGTRAFAEFSASLIRDAQGKPIGFRGVTHDVTERKRAEEQLRRSEERYRSMIETIQEGYFETDLTGKFTFVNDAQCRIVGTPREQLLGTSNRAYASAEESKRLYQLFSGLYKTGEPVKGFALEYKKRDGTMVVNEISASLIRDSQGEPIGFRGIARDVTERKRAEETLAKSEEKYRHLVENAQEGIYQSTNEGRYLTLNPAFARMIGYDSPEEVMATITDIAKQLYVNPDDRKKLLEIVNEKGSVTDFETEYYKKDGSRLWVSINMHAVRDDQGHILYSQGINQDITEKKKIETERQENIERLRKSLGATINAMAVTVETRDPYTAGHQRRVADLARAIATEINLRSDLIDGVRMAGIIHDIGKMSVPSEILTKPTKLLDLEFSLIKTHSQAGYDILKDIEFPWPVANVVLQHHERMNGSGYPQGLKGNDILLEARIIAVADVVESMASHRPYRPALGIEAALEEIEKNKGILYDNTVADACLRLFRERSYQLP